MGKFVDVILPLPLEGVFTYSVPEYLDARVDVGYRVVVPFGSKKKYTAIVRSMHDSMPAFETKDIESVFDDTPIVTISQLKLWEWVADYYLCSLGDVYKAAVPSGIRPDSETVIMVDSSSDGYDNISTKERLVLDLLSKYKECNISKVEKESGISDSLSVIRGLIDKQLVKVKEELKNSYKEKYETYVRLGAAVHNESEMAAVIKSMTRARKQIEVLNKYVELADAFSDHPKAVTKQELLNAAGAGNHLINQLIEKNVLETYLVETGRLKKRDMLLVRPNPLNEVQQRAYEAIMNIFDNKNVCLLHGVTSCGKTEIYIHLIDKYINEGKQILYLLPEIALTPQITSRLQRIFGDKLVVYHSKFSDAERVEIWKKQLGASPYQIVLGVRSSVLLPFTNLGLVIVDEEHENTFKQYEPAPRYNARDTAIVLANMFGAKTLLGTATPSMESYFNATNGKYGLVEINQRYKDIKLPEIIPVDIKEARRRRTMQGQFSPLLVEKISEALKNKEQIILFQNRRGFAPMIECRTCGWTPKCIHCDVSLTYHKHLNQLTCHYCGYTIPVPSKCPSCNDSEMLNKGFGTELVEDDIKLIFPEAKVARLDMDTTKSKYAHENIIKDFTEGKTDILVGTQMISKGLDFDNVSVVGIMNADNMMNFPDFRSYERAFQLMAQVSGRAGRKNKQGTVILQTYSPDNPVIKYVIENNFKDMYRHELEERRAFKYPPFYRIINIYIKHKKDNVAEFLSQTMAIKLRKIFGDRILGPDKPPVSKIQTYYIRKIILKMESSINIKYAKEQLKLIYRQMQDESNNKSFIIFYDVDPM